MIRTSSALFWFGLVILASIGLYRTSDRVQELNHKLTNLNTAIEAEQQSIHVLKAEWVYLSNPERIKTLADRHLALRATSPQQIISLGTMADFLPTRHDAMVAVAVTNTPIPNIRTNLSAVLPPQPQHLASVHAKTSNIQVASFDTGHITDHMTIRRTASAQQPSFDQIGTLISQLDEHP